MTISLPQLPGRNLLTNSRQSCFKRCPREHWHRYEQGVRPASDAPPLRIGGAFHDAADMRRKGADMEAIVQANDARYANQPVNSPEDAVELDIERVIVLALFDGYCKAWPDDMKPANETTHGLTPVQLIASEKGFELPLRHPDTNRKHPVFKRAGKIDFIAKLADGRTAIFETKTTGDSIDPSSDYWSVLAIDPQISGYLLAAQDMSIPAETIVYDVIHKPGMRPLSVPLLDDQGIKIVLDSNGERIKNKDGSWKQAGDSAKGYTHPVDRLRAHGDLDGNPLGPQTMNTYRMPLVYVAGPYRAASEWELVQNIRRAEETALLIWNIGCAVICPHKNTAHFGGADLDDTWLRGDIEMLRRCDAVFVLPNSEKSTGTQAEIEFARKHNIPVCYTLGEVLVQCLSEQGYARIFGQSFVGV